MKQLIILMLHLPLQLSHNNSRMCAKGKDVSSVIFWRDLLKELSVDKR